MRFFLRSRSFKIFVAVMAAVIVISTVVAVFSSVSSPISSLIGSLTTPVQSFFSGISAKIDSFNKSVSGNRDIMDENEKLREENARLTEKLSQFEQTELQNEYYERFLGIKEKNPDMLFQPANVSARDNTDPYGGFTIDAGLLDGVALHDPVITPLGLVGYISEVAPTYSKVTTILSPKLKAGGRDSRTADDGVISGRADLAKDNKCYFYNLQRDCSVSIGDTVVTAGGSIFPAGLVVGNVGDIKQQSKDTSLYAVLEPADDFSTLKKVMIITYYSGQGIIAEPEGAK